MKKQHILVAGLIFLISLLLCAAATAQAETPQPTKTAAQWKSEGYVVLSDRELPENFIVLSKDLTYLKEKTAGGGTVVNGNKFDLSNYNVVQSQNSTEGQDAYCIEAGGKYYFGMEDSAVSNANTLSLKLDTMAILDDITPPAAIAVAAYTVGAWIDWKFDVWIDDFDVEGIPFYFHGNGEVFLDHTSDATENTTHHTIQYYLQPHADDMGFQTKTETTTEDVHVCIFSYRGIDILWLDLKLEDFLGKFGVSFTFHDGLILHFDTWGPVPVSGISVEEDGPYIDTGISNVECTGNADVGFQVGVGGSFKPLIEEESITVFFGVTIEGTENDTRFVPEDTKMKWHSCDECVSEDIRTRDGPLTVLMDIWGLDPWSWSTPPKIGPVLKTWHYSKTWNEWGDGDCNRYSYRLSARVLNQNGVPIPNVSVTWPVDSDNPYFPQSRGTTNSFGTAVIYVESGNGRDIIAEATSPVDPSQKISQTQTIHKMEHFDDLTFTLDIPEKHVYFRNSQTGEAVNWPEDIVFMPFFSENVQIPDSVPELSGRQFIGWNTKEDGSGTSYNPGTKITLKDDLTLWAQWELTGDSWYVVYNANGGTKAPGPQIVPKGQDAVLTMELPEAGKMIFRGWTPDRQHPEMVYQPGDTLKYDSEKKTVVLYALWDLSPVPEPIHISFKANSLEEVVLPADIWLEENSWLQLHPAEAAYGSSWTFVGWSENPQATSPEFLAGETYYFYRDTELYAIWKKLDSVTLTFRDSLPDTSSGIPQPITIITSMSPYVHIPDQIPQKSGRVFTGWNTEQDGSGTFYAPGSVITLWKNTVLWAQWEIPENEWYVIYNANGGTKAPGPQIVPKGQDAVLTMELPEAGKMIFRGWTPDRQHPETIYQPGDTLKYDSEKETVVLYALWDLSPVPEPIHISFKANSLEEVVLPADVWLEENSWLQLHPAEAAYGSSWTFVGWSENPQATSPEFLAGETYHFYRDTELYAIWKKLDSVTLTFLDSLPGTASGIPEPITIITSMSPYVHIPEQIPEKSGRIFTGWNTAADGSGTPYAPGAVIMLAGDTVLWAQWATAGDSWYVIYNANGGTKAPVGQVVPRGQDAVLTTEVPEAGKMFFQGWATDPDAAAPEYRPGDTLRYDSAKTAVVLYALWSLDPAERPFVISFDANGGLPDTLPQEMSVPRGAWTLLPAQKPSWDAQHDFKGWAENPGEAEAKWQPGDAFMPRQSTVLYALWKAHYRITEGAGSVWTKGSGKAQRFVADGNKRYFKELLVDGKPLNGGVTITDGSTVAVIDASAMETLSIGSHMVTFVYIDGEATAPFTVRKKLPPTGDAGQPWLWLGLMILGGAGLGCLRLNRRKHRKN